MVCHVISSYTITGKNWPCVIDGTFGAVIGDLSLDIVYTVGKISRSLRTVWSNGDYQ